MDREEANVCAVFELLRTARNYPKALADLRRRLRDAENGLRLTEAGKTAIAAYPGVWLRRNVPMAPPVYSWERMAEIYRKESAHLSQRIELLRQKRLLLELLLSGLSELEFQIISLKWLDGRTWQAVSMRAYVCERHGQRIQKRAIEKMARALAEEAQARQSSLAALMETSIERSEDKNRSLNP
ncbi:MAG: hypothetical protein RSA12_04960 [Clostridia bacterium]